MTNLASLILLIGLTIPGFAGVAAIAPEGMDENQPLFIGFSHNPLKEKAANSVFSP